MKTKKNKAPPFGIVWSLMAGGVMFVENAEKAHIFFPHEIINVNAANENLVVVVHLHSEAHKEDEAFSYTLNPESVLPSVAENAKNAGLPIAEYAASKIRYAKMEQQLEDQRLMERHQIFCHEPFPSLEEHSLSVARNRVFMVFPIIATTLFVAMIYYGHDRGQAINHLTVASHLPR